MICFCAIMIIFVVWLLIGLVVVAQCNYFESLWTLCAKVGMVFVMIVVGLLNYIGANLKIDCSML